MDLTGRPGIGFTMSLFIAGLAFADEALKIAKLAILSASLVAGAGGSSTYKARRRPADWIVIWTSGFRQF